MFERTMRASPSRSQSEESCGSIAETALHRLHENAAEVSLVKEPRPGAPGTPDTADANAVDPGLRVNRLLGALSTAAYATLEPHIEHVTLLANQVLQWQGSRPSHVYFPESGILTVTRHSRNGERIGIGLIGSEGVVGGGLISLSAASPTECTVHLRGTAKRLSVAVFEAAANTSLSAGSLGHAIATYNALDHADALQSVLCQSLHTVLQRCARWMLMMDARLTADRGAQAPFPLTHAALAEILGVRRAGVTVAAGLLQNAGLVQYRRGNVVVTNRAGLKAISCDCYNTAVMSSTGVSG